MKQNLTTQRVFGPAAAPQDSSGTLNRVIAQDTTPPRPSLNGLGDYKKG